MRILITRPLEDAPRQAEQLRTLGHTPLIFPLLEIAYASLSPLQLDGIQALIVTSQNALRALAHNASFEDAKSLPLYCVGPATADLARDLGFKIVLSGNGQAADLVPAITHTAKTGDGALLYCTGQNIAFDLETPLKNAGFLVPRIICYEARELHMRKAAMLAEMIREGEFNSVILMSPRTSSVFVKIIKRFEVEREVRAITCYCYSNAISKPLGDIDGLAVKAASHPSDKELLGLIGPAANHGKAYKDLEQALGKR